MTRVVVLLSIRTLAVLLGYWFSCAASAVAAESAPAASAESSETSEDLTGAVVTPGGDRCPGGSPVDVDFLSLTRNPERFSGLCVRTVGLWSLPALYSDADTYYRIGPRIGGSSDAAAQGQIGLYVPEDFPMGGEAVEPDAFRTSPSIKPLSIVRFARVTGRLGMWLGDLVPLGASWPQKAPVVAAVTRWLNDIRKRDIADFAELHDLAPVAIDLEDEESEFRDVFVSTTSPFAALRSRRDPGNPRYFRVATRPAVDDEQKTTETFACFCSESSCEGRWPISSVDAANSPNRPYACVEVTQWVVVPAAHGGKGYATRFISRTGKKGFCRKASWNSI